MLKLNVLVNVVLNNFFKKISLSIIQDEKQGSQIFETKTEQNHIFRSLLDVFSESENIDAEVSKHLFGIKIKNQCKTRTGRIRIFGARNSVLLKANSGERCAPQNFVQLATFRGTQAHLIVYLVVHQMKHLMERYN